MKIFGARALAAEAVYRGSRQALTKQNITDLSRLAGTVIYLNKDISI